MYKIIINLNISQIRSILKRFNKLKLTRDDKRRCKKFDAKLEQVLASKEIENSESKIPFHAK